MKGGLFNPFFQNGADIAGYTGMGSGGDPFSGNFLRASFPVLNKQLSDNSIRETCHFEIDDNTWGMSYQRNLLSGVDNVGWATSLKSNPHVYTQQVGSVLLNSSWATGPEGLKITKLGNDWCGLYTDRVTRKLGMATRSTTFGQFTDHGSAILDFTALADKGYRYLRHVSAPKFWGGKWWATIEGRNYNATSPEDNRGNRKIWLIFSGDTFPNLVNWTIVETPIFDPDLYSGKFIGNSEPWTPTSMIYNNRYYVMWWGLNMRANQDEDRGSASFNLMYSTDANLDSWTFINRDSPFLQTQTVCGSGDAAQFESPELWMENGNIHVYYNGNSDIDAEGLNYETGYYTMLKGSPFIDAVPANLVEDNFDDNSLDTTKWTYTPSSGITISETGGSLVITGDGSVTQSTPSEILKSKLSYKRNDKPVLVISFDLSFNVFTGGGCRIGLFNSDNSKYIAFGRGGSGTQITKLLSEGSYNTTVTVAANKFKIVISGCYAAFYQYTNGQWTDLDPDTTTRWRDVSTWSNNDDLYVKVLATNVSGTSFTATIDNMSLRQLDSPYVSPFIISNRTSSIISSCLSNYSAVSSKEISALTTFITACINNGNWWDMVDGLVFKLNATDALKHLISGTSATNTSATKTANGFSFNGTNSSIDSGKNLRTVFGSSNNRMALSAYVYAAGDQSANRTILGSNDGTNLTRLFYTTSVGYGFSLNATSHGVFTGPFTDDTVYAMQRDYNESKAQKIYKNNIPMVYTGGNAFAAIPNANLLFGSIQTAGNFFAGTLSAGFMFKKIHDFEAWNIDLRRLISDLT